MDYLDFDIEIREGDGHVYLVAARSLVGEGQTSAAFPFTDDLSGFHDALMVFNPIVGTTQSASTQPNASHLVTDTLADGIYVSTLKRAMTSIGTENRNKVFRAGKSVITLYLLCYMVSIIISTFAPLHPARVRNHVTQQLPRGAQKLTETTPPLGRRSDRQ